VTSFAQVAKKRVLRDCSTWLSAGLMVQIMAVLAFPPRESCNIRVNFESLYGMWPLLFPILKEARKEIIRNQAQNILLSQCN